LDPLELQSLYSRGERKFDGVLLNGANLAGAVLSSISLKNAALRGADLTGALLSKADLSGADLYAAKLDGADLRESNLAGASLDAASLISAVIRESSLAGASLIGTDLRAADLRASDLSGSICVRGNFLDARLDFANLTNAFFEEANLRGVGLAEADVRGAHFRGVELETARVAGLRFDRTTRFKRSNVNGLIGDPVVSRFAKDQEFLEAFAARHPWLFLIWNLTSACGTSMARWLLCSAALVIGFGLAFSLLPNDFMLNVDSRTPTPFTFFYYSIVIFTTLGFGDVIPRSLLGELLVSLEVLLGYLMLGGLISIFATKLARQA